MPVSNKHRGAAPGMTVPMAAAGCSHNQISGVSATLSFLTIATTVPR
jgi:hypothetical protein